MSTTAHEGTSVPEPVIRIAEVMSSYGRAWSLCGGWAIDAWIGEVTRQHGDVDLSVFDADHEDVFRHFAGWQLIAHHAGADASNELWDGRRLPVPSHLHARAPADAGPLPEDGICMPEKGWWLDIQVDHEDGGDSWVLDREHGVSLPIDRAIRRSAWGVPTSAPEVVLFFKTIETRRRDHEDFLRILRHLGEEQRAWLAEAIATVKPDHAWLTQLP